MRDELSEKIRLIRLSKNLSQQNIADELGITVSAYSNMERGVTEITIQRLKKIAEIFGVNVNEILIENSFFEEKNYRYDSIPQKLNSILNELQIQKNDIIYLKTEIKNLKKSNS
jgi:transcriptional regulator with XRE-family HTH domain